MSERHSPVGSVGTALHVTSRTMNWDQFFPSLPLALHVPLSHRAELNGSSSTNPGVSPIVSTLDELLSRDRTDWPAFTHTKITDSQRPPAELHAISAALACPDLFLIDVPTGNDQLVLACELAREAERQGQRVLVLTAEPIDADKLITRLREYASGTLLRALGAGEVANQIPTKSVERTAKAVGDGAVNQAKAKLQQTTRELEAHIAALQTISNELEPTRVAAERLEQFARDEARLQLEQGRLLNPTGCDDGTPLPTHFTELEAERSRKFTKLVDELHQATAKLTAKQFAATALNEQLTMLQQQADAKKSGGLLSAIKSLFNTNDSANQLPALELQVRSHDESVQELETEVARLTAEYRELLAANTAARERMLHEEFTRRTTRVNQQLAEIHRERAEAQMAFDRGVTLLKAAGFSGNGIPQIETVTEQLQHATADLQQAHTLRTNLETNSATIAKELVAACKIVAGPLSSLGVDVALRSPESRFDRVIVTDGELMTEQQVNTVLKYSHQWIFIGDESSANPVQNGNQRNGHGANPRPTAFRRMWQRYHQPTWVKDQRQLAVKLVAVPHSQRNKLRCEPVVDQPDIEVRFLAGVNGSTLAEVAFPANTRIGHAKTFLAGELGEVRLTPCSCVVWHETDGCVVASWPSVETLTHHADSDWAELGDGIREHVVATDTGCWTASLSFAISSGWTTESARTWLEDHTCAPRTATLPRQLHVTETATARKVAGVAR